MALIDFKQRILDQEKALEDFLAQRKAGIASGIDQTRTGIEGARGEALGPVLQSKLSGLGVTPTPISYQGNKLGLGLDEMLSSRQYGSQKERINLSYNKALDYALNAGKNRRESEAFARQIQQDEIRRQYEGQTNATARGQAIRQQGISSAATARQTDLQIQGIQDPMDEYQAAVIRIMTGMPAKLLTYYGLSGGFGGQSGAAPRPGLDTTGYQGIGPQGGAGTYPLNPYGR